MTTSPFAYRCGELAFPIFVVRDAPKRPYDLAFHLKSGDYLGVVATIVGEVLDETQEARTHNKPMSPAILNLLRTLRSDLTELHLTHRIVQKEDDDYSPQITQK